MVIFVITMASSSRTKTRKSSSSSRRLLLKILLSVSVVAILGGSYWQQQLLKGVDNTVGSSLVAQWAEAGLPRHSLGNVLLQNTVSAKNATSKSQTLKGNKTASNKTSDAAESLQQQLPPAFQSVLKQSLESQKFCNTLPKKQQQQQQKLTVTNLTQDIADLPDFGIIQALQNYTTSSTTNEWQCVLPPSTECNTTNFTIVFMGYNPDRLHQLKRQVSEMLKSTSQWNFVVQDVLLVWNGPRQLTSTKDGQVLQQLSNKHDKFRIFFPLEEGFPNDLMNRYHPRLNITTRAILFYDDDGPFYSYNAIISGFELWKRNSNAQIGAMARKLDLVGDIQQQQQNDTILKHCRAQGDKVRYNFYEFANYQARMVLPSGSFLHSNYLCFLWHPALQEMREFVRAHPVHPDDVTVSTIVSHLSQRAPLVYSRRINPKPNKETARRRLLLLQEEEEEYNYPRRRLLWQDVSKHDWATMRSMAVNSLVSYFGGINSGSVGWCHGTPYQQMDKKGNPICIPEMATIGMLPWMTENHKPKDTCP